MLLCTVRFDGRKHTLRVRAAVKTALESEQTRELQGVPQPELRRQRFHTDAAGWSTRTLTGLLPRALPLSKRCSVVDTVPTATRTPPRVPIRALPAKWLTLLGDVSRKRHVARSSRRSRVESYETRIVA